MKPPLTTQRLDKWLWAARFYKTRTLATEAVDGGHVQVNGVRVKPAKELRPGDRLCIVLGDLQWELVVLALSEQRGPAVVARALYEETPDSAAARVQRVAARKVEADPGWRAPRPSKRDRRMMDKLRRG